MRDPFRLDEWLAEPDLNTFTRDGRTVRVEPKVMELCVRLARTPGVVVSKAELLESVWPDTSVGEDALTRTISELRRALGDDAQKPRIVQTIPKRGYRLLASVGSPSGTGEPPGSRGRAANPRGLMLAALAGVLLLGSWWLLAARGSGAAPTADRVDVLVAGHGHLDGEPELHEIVRRAIERGLQRDGRIAVVSRQRVLDTLARMRRNGDLASLDAAVAVSRRDGSIGAILMLRVEDTSGEYLAGVQAMTGSGDRVIASRVVRGSSLSALAAALEREAASLRAPLLRLPQPVDSRLPPVTTASFAALQSFARGVEIAESSLALHGGTWSKAEELFQQAVALDPEFAMAHAWLGLTRKYTMESDLSTLGRTQVSVESVREHARKALALSGGAVSEKERFFIEGVGHTVLDERPQAIAALSALVWRGDAFMELPARLLLSFLYSVEGRADEADEQALRLAELRPGDFDANAVAADVLLNRAGAGFEMAAPFIERARRLASPAVVHRENSCWLAAWLEHVPIYELWSEGRLADALASQARITRALSTLSGHLRDAMATTAGHMWLTLGRVSDARAAFAAVGHVGQREWNLGRLAGLFDDRRAFADHLSRVPWAFSAAPYAYAGEFTRARAILREPTVNGLRSADEAIVDGEEALATGRPGEAAGPLQHAADLLRRRPHIVFYVASLSLARAWHEAGDPGQALRVLEETVQARPVYTTTGLAGAWWIKAQVRLVESYRAAGRTQDAAALEAQVRGLLAHADRDHPFLRELDASR